MFRLNQTQRLIAALCLAAVSACGQNAVPTNGGSSGAQGLSQEKVTGTPDAGQLDTTSILKQDKKNVVIGSTVDPKNGDRGPHGLSIVKYNGAPLKKGQLLVCNFANSKGKAGAGTTIELLNPTPGSSPKQFAANSDIEGCAGVAVSPLNAYVYGAGLTSKVLTAFSPKGVEQTTYGSPLEAPLSDTDVSCESGPLARVTPDFCSYVAEYIFTSDAKTGSIVSAGVNQYASDFYVQVATGFATNHGSGWGIRGPAGLQYTHKGDALYVADGVTNTVVEFNHASDLLVKNEIVVKPNGKKFKCIHKTTTCGTVVKAGSPLNAPIAMTLLPNGNLIVANGAPSKRGDELVEMTPKGQVLDKELVDSGAAPAIFGLASSGSKDSNTVIFYTDTNDNNVHELEP